MKPIKFKLRILKKKPEYFLVLIFPTKVAMLAYWKAQCGIMKWVDKKHSFEAQCSGMTGYNLRNGRWKKSGMIGQVLFHQEWLGVGIVSHELTHAAFRAHSVFFKGREAGLMASGPTTSVSRREEWFCLTCHSLNRQFWDEYYKATKTTADRGVTYIPVE